MYTVKGSCIVRKGIFTEIVLALGSIPLSVRRHVAFRHKTRRSYFNCQSFSFAGVIKGNHGRRARTSLNTEWDMGWIVVIRTIGSRYSDTARSPGIFR